MPLIFLVKQYIIGKVVNISIVKIAFGNTQEIKN